MDEKSRYENIIKLCAAALCLMFFVSPLMRVFGVLKATGWNIASGTGHLMEAAGGEGGETFVFVLLIIPTMGRNIR